MTEVIVYPLKGAKGVSPPEWDVDDLGLHLDRRWMLTDPAGHFLAQRTHPRLTLVELALVGETLLLRAPGMQELALPTLPPETDPMGGMEVEVEVEGDTVAAGTADPEASRWFQEFLRVPCQLVAMANQSVRWANPEVAPNQRIGFCNAYPIHLVAQASLDELNGRLDTPVAMSRFRPNLVVSGVGPYEEDRWRRIRIGDVELDVVKPCDHRCGVPNVDQETAERGVEPLRTLATYRRYQKATYFGQNLAPAGRGRLAVDTPVEVVEEGAARPPLREHMP